MQLNSRVLVYPLPGKVQEPIYGVFFIELEALWANLFFPDGMQLNSRFFVFIPCRGKLNGSIVNLLLGLKPYGLFYVIDKPMPGSPNR
jgi:hypothetical protein